MLLSSPIGKVFVDNGIKNLYLVSAMGRDEEEKLKSDLLTKIEAQEYLRVSRSTLDWLIKTGKIPVLKLRRRLFIRQRDIEKFIEESVQPLVPDIKKEPDE